MLYTLPQAFQFLELVLSLSCPNKSSDPFLDPNYIRLSIQPFHIPREYEETRKFDFVLSVTKPTLDAVFSSSKDFHHKSELAKGSGGRVKSRRPQCRHPPQELEPETSIPRLVLEKGTEIDAHLFSGAVIEQTTLDPVLPDRLTREDYPLSQPVTLSGMHLLTDNARFRCRTRRRWGIKGTMHPREIVFQFYNQPQKNKLSRQVHIPEISGPVRVHEEHHPIDVANSLALMDSVTREAIDERLRVLALPTSTPTSNPVAGPSTNMAPAPPASTTTSETSAEDVTAVPIPDKPATETSPDAELFLWPFGQEQ
ncbi:hypothetical protein C8R45DRAFT_1179194 [Mycena sanguinolenta]|nr:hypothetical protein C8R45DRAFT_1179194 [Mycena sanguinolenta]